MRRLCTKTLLFLDDKLMLRKISGKYRMDKKTRRKITELYRKENIKTARSLNKNLKKYKYY
ncbi:hypothetical protein GF367_01855 [Candidatus Woesearchaeota archaeon]|nr:hypothetical protein [Candidatus Woesearchaeota archaeon]